MFTSSTYTEAGARHTFSFLDGADQVPKPEESLRARDKPERNVLPHGRDGDLFTRGSIVSNNPYPSGS